MTNADWIALAAALGNWALVFVGSIVAWKTVPVEMAKYRAQKRHDARSQAAFDLWRASREFLLQLRTACSIQVHPDATGESPRDKSESSRHLRIVALQNARNVFLASSSSDLLFSPGEVATDDLWKLSAAILTGLYTSFGPTAGASIQELQVLAGKVDELEKKLREQLQPVALSSD